jgi:hypothetical protein
MAKDVKYFLMYLFSSHVDFFWQLSVQLICQFVNLFAFMIQSYRIEPDAGAAETQKKFQQIRVLINLNYIICTYIQIYEYVHLYMCI